MAKERKLKKLIRKRDKFGRFLPGKGKGKLGGRKTGSKNKKTILKEDAFKEHQQAILNELSVLRSAHFAVAKGTQIIVAKDLIWDKDKKKRVRRGRFVRLTRPGEIKDVMNKYEEGKDFYIIFTQDPNPKALEDLINRVFGRPKDQMEINFRAKDLKKIQDGIRAIIEMARRKYKLREKDNAK